jgi:hypothetical protein
VLQTKPQVLPMQVAVAWAGAGHTAPQPPQLDTSLVGFTSHPSDGAPLQSRYDPAHA